MRNLRRGIRALALIALFISSTVIFAQDDNVTIVGTGIVQELVENLASEAGVPVTFDVTGTDNGIAQFCSGDTNFVVTNRALTVEEEASCVDSEIQFTELLFAHDILTVITNPSDNFATCLTTGDLNTIFAPSAAEQFTTWSQFNADTTEGETTDPEATAEPEDTAEDVEVSVYIPADNTLAFATLDAIVDGLGLRADATTATFDEIITAVGETPGAIGVVPLAELDAADTSVVPVFIDSGITPETAGCQAPSADTVEAGLYSTSTTFYLYVNAQVQDDNADLLNVLTAESDNTTITEAGFSPISANATSINQLVLAGEEDGRAFTSEAATFEIPATLEGNFAIAGAGQGYGLANAISSQLTATHQGLTIDLNLLGDDAGLTALCADEAAIVFTTQPLDDETITCESTEEGAESTEVSIISYELGTQATVLLGNEADDFTVCLTTEQIATVWGAPATDNILNWSDVGEGFDDVEMTLFGIGNDASDRLTGNITTDLLFQSEDGVILPVRADTILNNDPLFRAAATANVPGSLTYMNWSDYNRVLNNEQEDVRLVAVDGGAGCVIPDETTILDGSYPLSSALHLTIRTDALANVNVQSYVWTLFQDNNYAGLSTDGYLGVDFVALPEIRESLLVTFTQAVQAEFEAQAAEAEAEATAEATESTD